MADPKVFNGAGVRWLVDVENGEVLGVLRDDDTLQTFGGGTFTVASQPEAENGLENTKGMTSLRTKQAIDAQVPLLTIADPGSDFAATQLAAMLQEAGARLSSIEAGGSDFDFGLQALGADNRNSPLGLSMPRAFGDATLVGFGAALSVYTAFGGTNAAAAASWADTDIVARSLRITYTSTTTTAGSAAGIRLGGQLVIGANNAGRAQFTIPFAAGDTQAGSMFIGLYSASGLTDVDPVANANVLGIGSSPGETTGFSIYTNDVTVGGGSKTVIAGTESWPLNDLTEKYVFKFKLANDGDSFTYSLTRLSTGITVSGTVTRTAAWPALGTTCQLHYVRTNGAGTGAKTIVYFGVASGNWTIPAGAVGPTGPAGPAGPVGIGGPSGDITAMTLNVAGMPLTYDNGFSWQITYDTDNVTPLTESIVGVSPAITRTFSEVAGSDGSYFRVIGGPLYVGDALSLTSTQRDNIATAVGTASTTVREGARIWNTTTKAFQVWNGSAWV